MQTSYNGVRQLAMPTVFGFRRVFEIIISINISYLGFLLTTLTNNKQAIIWCERGMYCCRTTSFLFFSSPCFPHEHEVSLEYMEHAPFWLGVVNATYNSS